MFVRSSERVREDLNAPEPVSAKADVIVPFPPGGAGTKESLSHSRRLRKVACWRTSVFNAHAVQSKISTLPFAAFT